MMGPVTELTIVFRALFKKAPENIVVVKKRRTGWGCEASWVFAPVLVFSHG
jgi:hypothetical protein